MAGHDCPTGYHNEPVRACYGHGCRCDECRRLTAEAHDPVVALRMPPEHRDALQRLAEAEGRSLSATIREAVDGYLAERAQDRASTAA